VNEEDAIEEEIEQEIMIYSLDKPCYSDYECDGKPFEECKLSNGSPVYRGLDGTCQHKDVFPILGYEFLGLTLLIMVTSISTVGGIGGGGLVVPFCMTFFGFSAKIAIALSGFTMFSCSVVRFLFFIYQKHPEKDAVLIDYNLVSIMLPVVMMGSMIGVLASITLPNLILQILLTILMILLTILTGLKGK